MRNISADRHIREHPGRGTCEEDPRCDYVVEQHQRFDQPEECDVPEFTIEVAYKTHDHVGNPVTPGWRYVIKWLENGENRQAREYGYATKAEALADAKRQADGIARRLIPVHVETYRPEI